MSAESRNQRLILASGSAGRAELMRRLPLSFERLPADIDESPRPGEAPRDLVERLAKEKALAIARKHPGALVIGSDQVAVFEGEATSKPGTPERARALLARYSGEEVIFFTAVCLLDSGPGDADAFVDITTVGFRALAADEIERYVALDDPLACAGGFKVESLGPALFRYVRSEDPTALQGLPLIALSGALRRRGLALP